MARTRRDIHVGSAHISSDGSILRQSGDITQCTRVVAGTYDIDWNSAVSDARDVIAGPFLVSFNVTVVGDGSVLLLPFVASVIGQAKRVRVRFVTVAGVATDAAFVITGTRILTLQFT